MNTSDSTFPRLHGRPAHGWVNDPNGLALIDGTYHVFFQYNPDAPVHTNIHWGHISSTGLVRWHQGPIALAPRAGGPDARGCWTGCLVDDGGAPTAVYTGASAADPRGAGVVLATSDRSAVAWTQADSAFEGSNEPLDIEVRDPYVFSFGGHRFALQGGGRADGSPRVLLYSCDDLNHWTYLGDLIAPDDPIANAYDTTRVWECPNLFELDGSWVLIVSPLLTSADGLVGGAVVAFIGALEPAGNGVRFRPATSCQVDGGASFYAPQVLTHGGRRLMWAWTRDLGRSPEDITVTGWTGALTFPRELRLAGDVLLADPAAELVGLRQELLHPNRRDHRRVVLRAGGRGCGCAAEARGRRPVRGRRRPPRGPHPECPDPRGRQHHRGIRRGHAPTDVARLPGTAVAMARRGQAGPTSLASRRSDR